MVKGWQVDSYVNASWTFSWQLSQRSRAMKLTATSTRQWPEVDGYVNALWAFSWHLRQWSRSGKLTATSMHHDASWTFSWQLRQWSRVGKLTATSTHHGLSVDSYVNASMVKCWQVDSYVNASWTFSWQLRQWSRVGKLTATSTHHGFSVDSYVNGQGLASWQLRQRNMDFQLTATSTVKGWQVDSYVNVSWALSKVDCYRVFSWQLRQNTSYVKLSSVLNWQLSQHIMVIWEFSWHPNINIPWLWRNSFDIDTYVNIRQRLMGFQLTASLPLNLAIWKRRQIPQFPPCQSLLSPHGCFLNPNFCADAIKLNPSFERLK